MKVKHIFIYEGDTYNLYYKKDNLKCYVSEESEIALITDDKDNVLFSLTADCAQNSAFLEFNKK